MRKIIFVIKRKAGTTREQFRDHYENRHVPMAHKYIGHLLQDYRRNYVGDVSIGSPLPGPPLLADAARFDHDVVTEMWFKDDAAIAEVGRIFGDPEIGKVLHEDEIRFLDRSSVIMLVVDELASSGDNLAVGRS